MIKGTKRQVGAVASASQHRKSILNLLPEGRSRRVRAVGMFDWEIKKEDFYIFDYDGTVYKIPQHDDPGSIYARDSEWPDKLVVPISAMKIVGDSERKPLDIDIPEDAVDQEDEIEYEELEDIPMSQLTVRQYACIKLGVPQSGLQWLDKIIEKSPLT